MKSKKTSVRVLATTTAVAGFIAAGAGWAADLGTAFTYQGFLERPAGTPVTDTCDFAFSLWDALAGPNQIGATQTVTGVTVSGGVFTVGSPDIDFGDNSFNGNARWLDIKVCCPSPCTVEALSPRVELTPAPYALRAAQGVGPPGALSVTPSGNVGIGTMSPTQKLDVDGNIHASGTIAAGNTITLYHNPPEVCGESPNTLALSVGPVCPGLDCVFIDTNCNVGVGTSMPEHQLQVNGNVSVYGNNSTLLFGQENVPPGNWGEWGIEYWQNAPGGAGLNFWKPFGSTGLGFTNNILFLADNTGNVGIGTPTPTSLLSVGSSSQFQVNMAGDIARINNVPYSFPVAQGAPGTVLQNNGSGNLAWAGASGPIGYWDLQLFAVKNVLRNEFFHQGEAINELQLGTVPVGASGGNTRLRLHDNGQWQINPWDGAGGSITGGGQGQYATMQINSGETAGLVSYNRANADWGYNIISDVGRALTKSYVTSWNGQDRFYVLGEGHIWAKSIFLWSDSSLKENIIPLEDSLDRILALQGYSYRYKAEVICADCDPATSPDFEQRTEIGLLAEEVETVVPEVVGTANDNTKAIAYQQLTALLIEAIKELHAHLESSLAALSDVDPADDWIVSGVNMYPIPAVTNVGIGTASPTERLHVDGNIVASGNITAGTGLCSCSDRRLKKNIEPISGALNKVTQLRGVDFRWRADEFPEMKFGEEAQIGLIAQEVGEVLPEVVVTNGLGDFQAIDYGKIVPVLVEAVKEQQSIIDTNRCELDELRKQKDREITELREKMAKFEALVNALAAQSDGGGR